jgi:hypothetical protein
LLSNSTTVSLLDLTDGVPAFFIGPFHAKGGMNDGATAEGYPNALYIARIGDRMLPIPDVGQKVRVEGHEGDFFVKSVSEDGGMVDVVA